MVNSMVERATSDMLIGPDWAMNIEICDMLNRDLTQAKDVVKGLKKRIRSRNPKVQVFALTLLETIIKNCGEVIHMHVAEKELPHEMVRIAKKKPDLRVKEKILILIDTWQEAFGGPRARYPQFYAAYQELLRIGAVFPQRTEGSAPLFTPPQTHPLSSIPQNLRSPENRQDGAESSAEAEFPTLSLTEIQNARGIMDVLSEMLNALDPNNKEGLRQDVIVDLVRQCRTFKQRVVHLVNSTSDESMLCQGLALNDDLQRLLAKHEALASGTTVAEAVKTEPESEKALVNVDAPLIDTGDSKPSDGGSTSNTGLDLQLLLPTTATNTPTTISTKADPNIDLLSGDFASPSAENTLALVPVGDPQSTTPESNPNNALALMDMFSENNNNNNNNINQAGPEVGHAYSSTQQYQQQPNFESPQGSVYPNNGLGPNMMASQYDQSQYPNAANSAWNGQLPPQQQPPSPGYDAQASGSLPLPPWEAQPADNNQYEGNQYPPQMQPPQQLPGGAHQGYHQPMGNDQVQGMYMQQPILGGHMAAMNYHGMYPQQMQAGQMAYQQQQIYQQQMYNNNSNNTNNQMGGYGYGYGQQQNTQYIDQRMSGLSVRDDNALRNSSHVPSGKPMKAEDKLFGDLVDLTKFKPMTKNTNTTSRTGSM